MKARQEKAKKALVVASFIVVVGFASYAFGFFGKRESARALLSGAYESGAISVDKSVHSEISIEKKTGVSLLSNMAKMQIDIAQKVGSGTTTTPSYKLSLDGYVVPEGALSDSDRMNIAGTALFANKTFYIEPTKIPVTPSYNLDSILNTWYVLDFATIAKELGGGENVAQLEVSFEHALQPSPESQKVVAYIFAKHPFIQNPHITGTRQTADGDTIKAVTFGINKKELENFIIAFNQYQLQKDGSSMTPEDIVRVSSSAKLLIEAMTIDPVVVEISTQTHHVQSAKVHFEIQAGDSSPDFPHSLVFSINMVEDYATPVSIEIPQKTVPFEKLLKSVYNNY